jgi:hypothetical protein
MQPSDRIIPYAEWCILYKSLYAAFASTGFRHHENHILLELLMNGIGPPKNGRMSRGLGTVLLAVLHFLDHVSR